MSENTKRVPAFWRVVRDIEGRKQWRHYDGRQCGHKVSGDERFCGHHRWIHDRADVAEKSPEVAEKSPPQECSICRGTHGLEVIHACE